MDFKSQQEKFDDIKWYDSIVAGYDRCGSYEFCDVCNKGETEPCARAAYRYQNSGPVRIATIIIKIGAAPKAVEEVAMPVAEEVEAVEETVEAVEEGTEVEIVEERAEIVEEVATESEATEASENVEEPVAV